MDVLEETEVDGKIYQALATAESLQRFEITRSGTATGYAFELRTTLMRVSIV